MRARQIVDIIDECIRESIPVWPRDISGIIAGYVGVVERDEVDRDDMIIESDDSSPLHDAFAVDGNTVVAAVDYGGGVAFTSMRILRERAPEHNTRVDIADVRAHHKWRGGPPMDGARVLSSKGSLSVAWVNDGQLTLAPLGATFIHHGDAVSYIIVCYGDGQRETVSAGRLLPPRVRAEFINPGCVCVVDRGWVVGYTYMEGDTYKYAECVDDVERGYIYMCSDDYVVTLSRQNQSISVSRCGGKQKYVVDIGVYADEITILADKKAPVFYVLRNRNGLRRHVMDRYTIKKVREFAAP